MLLSPYAPHLAEELWSVVGGEGLVLDAVWLKQILSINKKKYIPVSFNGKVRFQLALPARLQGRS